MQRLIAVLALVVTSLLPGAACAAENVQTQSSFHGTITVNGQPMTFTNAQDFMKALNNLPLSPDQTALITKFFQNAPPVAGNLFPNGLNNAKSVDDFVKAIDNLPIDAAQKALLKQQLQQAGIGGKAPAAGGRKRK